MATIWHTYDNKEAVRSRVSLWRIVGKPPKLHVIAWSTENNIPQVQDDTYKQYVHIVHQIYRHFGTAM